MVKKKKLRGLTDVTFAEDPALPYPQPDEITAHENSIMITAWTKAGDRQEVFLPPRHIEVVRAMTDDWWDAWWAALHEKQA